MLSMYPISGASIAGQLATAAVAQPTVTGVVVSPASLTLNGGDAYLLSAVVNGDNSPSQGVTWVVNGGSINSSGMFIGPVAIASVQTITAKATSTQDGNYSGSATITIRAAIPHVAPPTVASSIHTRARHRGRR